MAGELPLSIASDASLSPSLSHLTYRVWMRADCLKASDAVSPRVELRPSGCVVDRAPIAQSFSPPAFALCPLKYLTIYDRCSIYSTTWLNFVHSHVGTLRSVIEA